MQNFSCYQRRQTAVAQPTGLPSWTLDYRTRLIRILLNGFLFQLAYFFHYFTVSVATA